MPLALAALGGNAIASRSGSGAGWDLSLATAVRALAQIVAAGWSLVVTHGNGPQVGELLLATVPGHPPAPLDVLDAETQGSLGYLIQQALGNELLTHGIRKEVAALVTQVQVEADDPAFDEPTKPVGVFYGREAAERLRRGRGWKLVEDAGRGYRRVVPSPRPVAVIEWKAVSSLLATGAVVIAAGGGGVPVVRDASGALHGVEAVVDKDRTSGLLACRLGAERLLILTGVPHVMLGFGGPHPRPLASLSATEARRHLASGTFAPGSMAPKVEAAAGFAEQTGCEALITAPDVLPLALQRRAGTWVHG